MRELIEEIEQVLRTHSSYSERQLLLQILKGQRAMALNFANFNTALAALQADVASAVTILGAPDTDQATLDAATTALNTAASSLAAVLPAPVPPVEPAPSS